MSGEVSEDVDGVADGVLDELADLTADLGGKGEKIASFIIICSFSSKLSLEPLLKLNISTLLTVNII